MNNSNYYSKYLKYKNKYLNLKKNLSGSGRRRRRRIQFEENSVHLLNVWDGCKTNLTNKQRSTLNDFLNRRAIESISIEYLNKSNIKVRDDISLDDMEYFPYPDTGLLYEFMRIGPWSDSNYLLTINFSNDLKIRVRYEVPYDWERKIVWEINSEANTKEFSIINNLMDCILFKDRLGQLFIPFNNQIRALNNHGQYLGNGDILLNPENIISKGPMEIIVKLNDFGQKLLIKQKDSKITFYFEGSSGEQYEIIDFLTRVKSIDKFIIGGK